MSTEREKKEAPPERGLQWKRRFEMATAKKASFRSSRIFRLARWQIKLGPKIKCNILKNKDVVAI